MVVVSVSKFWGVMDVVEDKAKIIAGRFLTGISNLDSKVLPLRGGYS